MATNTETKGIRVALGDVAINSTATAVDPEAEGFERYIIGRHIPPDEDQITTWGQVGDGSFGSRIRTIVLPGDVVCTTRGPNLKVARATFKALGAHTNFYLRTADSKVLMQEYLELVVRSDGFQQHLSDNFRGSVNLFVNWSDAREYEFQLPPLEEQHRVIKLLESCATHAQALKEMNNALKRVFDAMLHARFSSESDQVPLADWCERPITYGIVQAGPDIPGGVPYIRVSDMTKGPELKLDGMLRTSDAIARKYKRSEVRSEDIVVALRGPVGLAMVVPPELDGANLTQGTARISVDSSYSRDYVLYGLQSPNVRYQYLRVAKGSTFSELSLTALRGITLPMKNPVEQAKICEELAPIVTQMTSTQHRVESSAGLSKSIIAHLLGGH